MKSVVPPVRRLADLSPAGGELTPMEEIAERELLLTKAQKVETKFGPGYIMTLSSEEDFETEFTVMSSAVVIVKQLDALVKEDGPFAFTDPLAVRFVMQGRCWTIQ